MASSQAGEELWRSVEFADEVLPDMTEGSLKITAVLCGRVLFVTWIILFWGLR